MRLQPALGRLFTEEDDRTPGAHPLVVLSNELWERQFGASPDVIEVFPSHGSHFHGSNLVL